MKRKFRIVKLFDLRQGTSEQTGREWKNRDVLLEADDDVLYPDRVVASLSGDMADNPPFKEGDIAEIALAFIAHEYQGRYFNNIRVINLHNS